MHWLLQQRPHTSMLRQPNMGVQIQRFTHEIPALLLQDDIDPAATPRTPRERIGLTGNLASISMPGDSGAEVTPRPIEFSDSSGAPSLLMGFCCSVNFSHLRDDLCRYD